MTSDGATGATEPQPEDTIARAIRLASGAPSSAGEGVRLLGPGGQSPHQRLSDAFWQLQMLIPLLFVGLILLWTVYSALFRASANSVDAILAAVVTAGTGVMLYGLGKIGEWRERRAAQARADRKRAWQFALLEGASRSPQGLDLAVLKFEVRESDRELAQEAAMDLIHAHQLALENGRLFYIQPTKRQLTAGPGEGLRSA